MKTIETTIIKDLPADKVLNAIKVINGFDIDAHSLKDGVAVDIINLHYIINNKDVSDYSLEIGNLVYKLEMLYKFACNLEKELTTY